MHNAFTSTHLACMEMSVLVFFDWEVHHPTIATFLDFFALLAMFPSDMARCRDSPAQLLNLESSLKNYLSYFLDTALKGEHDAHRVVPHMSGRSFARLIR